VPQRSSLFAVPESGFNAGGSMNLNVVTMWMPADIAGFKQIVTPLRPSTVLDPAACLETAPPPHVAKGHLWLAPVAASRQKQTLL
jgi:hypothetical protein